MAVPASHKICVVCGTDCDGKPRVKHKPTQRYFCAPCYEKARAAKLQRQLSSLHGEPVLGQRSTAVAAMASPKVAPKPAPRPRVAEIDCGATPVDDLAALPPIIASLERASRKRATCPACGGPPSPPDQSCRACGYRPKARGRQAG